MNELFLIAGPCVIEDTESPIAIAARVKEICEQLNLRFIFKASYKKANRSRLDSFTGIGDEAALTVLSTIRDQFGVEVITDVHSPEECRLAAQHVDYLQIPAFLCRQTALLLAAGETGCGVNIKKGQFLSPEAMRFAMEKVQSTGNDKIWLTERGTTFGYNDLVVDITGIPRMQRLGGTVVMDCTHSVQIPNQTSGITGGDPEMIETLALASVAAGVDGLFLEVHPDPANAKSDAGSQLQLEKLAPILEKCIKVRNALTA